MTVQDLKNNRNRIINQIPSHYNKAQVMEIMVRWCESFGDPKMKNIDKLVFRAKEYYVKNIWEAQKIDDMGTYNLERARANMPSSMRR